MPFETPCTLQMKLHLLLDLVGYVSVDNNPYRATVLLVTYTCESVDVDCQTNVHFEQVSAAGSSVAVGHGFLQKLPRPK